MNYYQARQRKSDGRWDFTCKNDGRIWPVGYCRGWPNYTEEEYARIPGLKEELETKLAPHRPKFHEDGHATSEEACACYRRYLLDTSVRLDGEHPSQQNKCAICGAWTTKYATVDNDSPIDLCAEHLTRESLEQLYSKFSSITSSY